MSIGQMLFSPSGRIRRRDYWLWSIAAMIANMVLFFSNNFLFSHGVSFYGLGMYGFAAPPGYIAAELALMLLSFWVNFCITAKRAHDRNRPAIVAGLVLALSTLHTLVSLYFPTLEALNTPLRFIMMFAAIWLLVDCGCLDGTKGPNKYGPSPKQIQAPADVF